MKKAYFSNRIYKNTLPAQDVESIQHTLTLFNRAKHFVFQTTVKEERTQNILRKNSFHITTKQRFDMDDYYTNSVVQEAKALMKSQKELNQLYIQNKEQQIKAVKKKIKTTKSRLTVLRKIKLSFVQGKPKFNQTSPEQQRGVFFVVHFKKRTDLYYHPYSFEHQYLDMEIQRLRSRLGNLEFKWDRYEKQLQSLKKNISSVVFGSKKLMKAQFTKKSYVVNHSKWRSDFQQARYSNMTISGRKDAKNGNFVFSYDTNTMTLTFMTVDKKVLSLAGVTFPYGQEKVNQAIQTQQGLKNKKEYGKPIAWSLEDHGSYYIIKCIMEEDPHPYINFSRANGLIGVDCNVDHVAFAEINEKGQLLHSGSIPFHLEGKTSGQTTKILELVAVALIQLAQNKNKPIVVEKLDTTLSKLSQPYGKKKSNRRMSLFAYRKLLSVIRNRADKMGVGVFEVNPAYTSQIGKMKYMKRFGTSIHESAAFVIARRKMGFKEKLPPVLYSLVPEKIRGLHHGAHWKYSMNLLSDIRTPAFYQAELFDLSKFCLTDELFPLHVLTSEERKGLEKIKKARS